MNLERKNSETLSNAEWVNQNKLIIYSAIVAFLGFIDATYLTIEHFKNTIPPCTISGCEVVLTSQFATFFGIPIALFGSLFYLSVIILSLLILTNYKKVFMQMYYLLAISGLVVSAVLFGLQAFVIKSFCQYCLLSAATSTGIFLLAALQYRKEKSLKIEAKS